MHHAAMQKVFIDILIKLLISTRMKTAKQRRRREWRNEACSKVRGRVHLPSWAVILLQVRLERYAASSPLFSPDGGIGRKFVVFVVVIVPLLAVNAPYNDSDGANENQCSDTANDTTDDLLRCGRKTRAGAT